MNVVRANYPWCEWSSERQCDQTSCCLPVILVAGGSMSIRLLPVTVQHVELPIHKNREHTFKIVVVSTQWWFLLSVPLRCTCQPRWLRNVVACVPKMTPANCLLLMLEAKKWLSRRNWSGQYMYFLEKALHRHDTPWFPHSTVKFSCRSCWAHRVYMEFKLVYLYCT